VVDGNIAFSGRGASFKISFEAIKCPTAGVGEILARKEAEGGTIA
jgi:hypothetical protein